MSVPTSQEVKSSSSDYCSSSYPQLMFRRFPLSEIQLATQNLDESLVIGRGGFGKVYKGTITNGPDNLTAAIKRLDSTSNQGASEFWAEINMLSNLRHCHLVSLIGYCNDEQEMILVYEYMSRGSLEDHLHKRQTPLSWVQRLLICIGAARGLDYLHTGTGIKHGVVHRDVKSSNILLDDSWAAKISDFGLSKICPRDQQTTYINTGFKGTFGYVDPDYFYTGKLSRKSDVYAFGVVLFEVLCGKRAVDSSIVEEHWNLAVWAQEYIKDGRLKQIVDTYIIGAISPKCLNVFAELAKRCFHKNPKQRPTMSEVVASLESILALQVKANNTLQPTTMRLFARKAPEVLVLPPNDKISEGKSLKSLESYFDTVGGEDHTLCRFNFDAIKVATDNFCEANKVPKQPSYKGKLKNGRGIAVSEPYDSNKLEEYSMNEVSILVKLEHENVAKLLGYCTEGTRLFLVYDFAPHATLDHIIFDPECTLLNWDTRYKIILGVSRALLYLHRDASVRIIHGDVAPGNILLDESLNPILSSFWYARCLAINETACRVDNFGGTWGYLAPEYFNGSYMSTKADVYSLGVLVLEIITGHRMTKVITGHRSTGSDCIFLEYVKRNWLKGTLSNIIDPRIKADSSSLTSFVEIGLLCVQNHAADRPTMEEVVSMLLDSASLTLPVSKMRARIKREGSNTTSAPAKDYYVTDYDIGAVEEFKSELFPR